MPLTRDEILQYAQRYVDAKEIVDFPYNGDLFCFFERSNTEAVPFKDGEGWKFGGYGIGIAYELDVESKPLGKWMWFSYASLSAFPPAMQILKLQPPHIVRGIFANAERTKEIRIVRVPLDDKSAPAENPQNPGFAHTASYNRKILKFPART
jgi:hypothetical protein